MTPCDILTPRLRLVVLSEALLQADFGADLPRFSALLHAEVPGSWPPEHWEPHCLDFFRKQFAEHPHTRSWGRYIVLQGSAPVLIGTVGAFPRTATEIEIGYGILPPWQCRGYATEAARALIGALLDSGGASTISAQTYPHLVGSLRVMERCGMHPAGPGDEPGTVRYQLTRPPGAGS